MFLSKFCSTKNCILINLKLLNPYLIKILTFALEAYFLTQTNRLLTIQYFIVAVSQTAEKNFKKLQCDISFIVCFFKCVIISVQLGLLTVKSVPYDTLVCFHIRSSNVHQLSGQFVINLTTLLIITVDIPQHFLYNGPDEKPK